MLCVGLVILLLDSLFLLFRLPLLFSVEFGLLLSGLLKLWIQSDIPGLCHKIARRHRVLDLLEYLAKPLEADNLESEPEIALAGEDHELLIFPGSRGAPVGESMLRN